MPLEGKVYVTGMGAVCCLGAGVEEFWRALLAGQCGLRPIERFDLQGSPYVTGGEAAGVSLEPFERCGVSMGAQLAAHAAREAVEGVPEELRRQMALVLGTNFGPADALEVLLDGKDTRLAQRLAEGPLAWDAEHVAAQVGAGGERVCISLSCSSGNAALAHGLALVRSGAAPAALVGGYDSMQQVTWAGLSCLRVMAPGAPGEAPRVRPFDKNRSGTLFSEGAGMLLLESAESARARNAEPLAELAGASSNNNAFHMTHPDPEGRAIAELLRTALHDAGLGAEEVGHVNAHGTGTRLNDAAEARAIRAVFGPRADELPVTSLKGAVGHAMGAASALEAVASVLSLREGLIPPTLNYETPDPECRLRVVGPAPLEAQVDVVVSNSAGIGGGNAAVVFVRPQRD